MHRMGRRSGAVGFALYLDLLEQMPSDCSEYDVDVLLLYGEGVEASAIKETIGALTAEGKSVSAQKSVPEKLRARETLVLSAEGRQ